MLAIDPADPTAFSDRVPTLDAVLAANDPIDDVVFSERVPTEEAAFRAWLPNGVATRGIRGAPGWVGIRRELVGLKDGYIGAKSTCFLPISNSLLMVEPPD